MEHIVVINHQGPPVFEPKTLDISAGDTVIWRNQGPMVHTATRFDDPPFDTGEIPPQTDSAPISFDTPATGLSYECIFHSFMTGTINVA